MATVATGGICRQDPELAVGAADLDAMAKEATALTPVKPLPGSDRVGAIAGKFRREILREIE